MGTLFIEGSPTCMGSWYSGIASQGLIFGFEANELLAETMELG
jgi:hypothetical protein